MEASIYQDVYLQRLQEHKLRLHSGAFSSLDVSSRTRTALSTATATATASVTATTSGRVGQYISFNMPASSMEEFLADVAISCAFALPWVSIVVVFQGIRLYTYLTEQRKTPTATSISLTNIETTSSRLNDFTYSCYLCVRYNDAWSFAYFLIEELYNSQPVVAIRSCILVASLAILIFAISDAAKKAPDTALGLGSYTISMDTAAALPDFHVPSWVVRASEGQRSVHQNAHASLECDQVVQTYVIPPKTMTVFESSLETVYETVTVIDMSLTPETNVVRETATEVANRIMSDVEAPPALEAEAALEVGTTFEAEATSQFDVPYPDVSGTHATTASDVNFTTIVDDEGIAFVTESAHGVMETTTRPIVANVQPTSTQVLYLTIPMGHYNIAIPTKTITWRWRPDEDSTSTGTDSATVHADCVACTSDGPSSESWRTMETGDAYCSHCSQDHCCEVPY